MCPLLFECIIYLFRYLFVIHLYLIYENNNILYEIILPTNGAHNLILNQ